MFLLSQIMDLQNCWSRCCSVSAVNELDQRLCRLDDREIAVDGVTDMLSCDTAHCVSPTYFCWWPSATQTTWKIWFFSAKELTAAHSTLISTRRSHCSLRLLLTWRLDMAPLQYFDSVNRMKSRDATEFEFKSECCRIPTVFLQIRNSTDFQTHLDSDSAFVLESPGSSFVVINSIVAIRR